MAVDVRLALVSANAHPAELFVADVPRKGHSELLDAIAALLDADASFIPVRSDGNVQLLGKHAIAWIAVGRTAVGDAAGDDDSDDDFAEIPSEVITLYERQHRVAVKLVAGGQIEGSLFDSSPSDRPRVADHLNGAGRFVRLWTANEHYLVNKTQIVQVTEL